MPPLRAWAGIAAAALVGAALVPSGPPGIGLLVTGAAIAAAIRVARPRPFDLESAAFAGAALVLVGMATVYAAPWVIAVDLAAAAVCAALAITGARTWATLFAGPVFAVVDSFRAPVAAVRAFRGRGSPAPWLAPAGRAAATSLVLLVTFGALFASADAAFAQIAENVLFPDVGLDLLPARIFVAGAIVAGAGGLVLVAQRREGASEAAEPPARLKTTLEWAGPLLVLDALFAAFVVVQLAVLFGGHDHVLETAGLTYAQYARAGFFQLVVIAALVLGVIALAVRIVPPGRERLLKILLGALCVLTLVVLASALRRMDLYEDAYGLTRIRVAVYAVDLWLAGLFATVILAGLARDARWLPRAVAALTIAGLLAFNLSNPDGRIARSAVDRWERTGEIDAGYVSTLSTDALPALLELPPDVGGCVWAPIAGPVQHEPGPWSSFNLSRRQALDVPTLEETGCS
ncbi:MAG TPA: DUF4173 domain-containing protein [Actinomycetota bacterium]|nr:DUF4173 domain-containing protein [Actinomycetota bacterium]